MMSVTDLDRELLARCLTKKTRAWEDFVDRFLGLVLHIIDHTASTREIRLSIEDRSRLCENIFAALGHDNCRLLRNFRERSSLTTYLSVVVRRIVVRILLNQTGSEKFEQSFRKVA
jgi:RNA polymerase sigma-70 factor (ECF subfamily)